MKNKVVVGLILIFILLGVFIVWIFNGTNTDKSEIYIKTGSNPDSLYGTIMRSDLIHSKFSFDLAWYFMDIKKVYPGKYLITETMTNREIINMFKYGKQTEIDFRFGNNILPHELYGALGKKFESDSVEFAKAIEDTVPLRALGLDKNSVLAMFWADTYRFSWSISPDKMVRRFIDEQQKFWDSERFNLLGKTGLKSAKEVYVLASIVEKEAVKEFELPIIAGVYINRLRIGMPLQADPTVKYAAGIRSMQRVKGILDIESPYNTYKYKGLPPGPIGIATKKGVDQVLNFKKHDYLYFCAKEDFSSTHYFTKSYTEHQKNARKYRAALDARGIK